MTKMLQQILVAIDGSENGKRAFAFALGIARRHDSELVLCHVVDRAAAMTECLPATGGVDFMLPLVLALDDTARSILATALSEATDANVPASTTLLDGAVAGSIVACAKQRDVDAIVMGTQGRRNVARFFLGSTADGVLRRSDVPVFVVPPATVASDRSFGRILVAVDDSAPSNAAGAFALELAEVDRARLILCGVAATDDLLGKAATYGYDPTPMLDELHTAAAAGLSTLGASAQDKGVVVESIVADGDPATMILRTAEEQHADVIVIGTHGRRGVRRLFAGSVAESVVCRSAVPVLVLRCAPRLRPHPPKPIEPAVASAGYVNGARQRDTNTASR